MPSKLLQSAAALAALCGARQTFANPQFTQEPATATLFSDNFSSGFGNWTVGTNTVGNTMFGQTPTLVTGAAGGVSTYARMKVDTYNSARRQAGVTVSGTQINTNQTFSLPTSGGATTGQGVQYQITARVEATGSAGGVSVTTPQGLNAAAFSYGYNAGTPNYLNEIDFENLTSQQSAVTGGATAHSNAYFGTSNGDATLATSYAGTSDTTADNSYYAQTPYAAKDRGSTATPINIYTWHTFDIDWYPNQIDWYVDGQLVREEAAGETSSTNPTIYIPNQTMAFYLNFWAPADTFTDAYSATLAPSATAAANQEYYYDVANASVNTIAAAGTAIAVPEPTSIVGLAGLIGTAALRRNRCSKKQ